MIERSEFKVPPEITALAGEFLDIKELETACQVSKSWYSIFSRDSKFRHMRTYKQPIPTHIIKKWSNWPFSSKIFLYQCTPSVVKEKKDDPICIYQEFGAPSDIIVTGFKSGRIEIETTIQVSGTVGRGHGPGPSVGSGVFSKVRQVKTIQHHEHKKEVTDIVLLPDKQHWISVSIDNVVCIWKGCSLIREFTEQDLLDIFNLDSMLLNSISVLPNGEIVHLNPTNFQTCNLFDAKPQASLYDLDFHPIDVKFHRNLGYLVSRESDSEDMLDHAPNVKYKGIVAVKRENNEIKITEMTDNGKLVAVGDKDLIVVRLAVSRAKLSSVDIKIFNMSGSSLEGTARKRDLHIMDLEKKRCNIKVEKIDFHDGKHQGHVFPLPAGRFAVVTGETYGLLRIRIVSRKGELLTNIELVARGRESSAIRSSDIKKVYQMPNDKLVVLTTDGIVRTFEFELKPEPALKFENSNAAASCFWR